MAYMEVVNTMPHAVEGAGMRTWDKSTVQDYIQFTAVSLAVVVRLTMQYYSAVERKEVLMLTRIRMNSENNKLSERNQAKKD